MNDIKLAIPLQKAWNRTKWILFDPFNAGKWFCIGFATWLVLLTQGESVASQILNNLIAVVDNPDALKNALAEKLGLVVILLGVLSLVSLIVTIGLQWVSSRAQFVFLDQVVRNRQEIAAPWKAYRDEGQSLFLWQVAFMVILFLAGYVVLGIGMAMAWTSIQAGILDAIAWRAIIVIVILLLTLALIAAFIQHLLINFIIPIMYRQRLDAFAGWRVFMPWLKKYFGRFFLFAYLVLILRGLLIFLVTLLGLLTCCCGLILLGIPYLSVVILLPYHVLFRAYGPEYLAQFSPDLDPFIPSSDEPEPASF